ncbi:hypothetical protein LTR62_003931 [Meristemomyces frigidus]|uniref:DASH complex subunit DAD3 n=1 Tax=Meristemomyces frigidus TaxID=1508187 RepID=A0AAN7TII2_9PEZI|nr:hypothetical protein LTR62_003931 [Meristemomyces frigidus]
MPSINTVNAVLNHRHWTLQYQSSVPTPKQSWNRHDIRPHTPTPFISDANMDTPLDTRPQAPANGDGDLTPLEQDVLDEYAKLAGNLDNLSVLLAELANNPSAEILDALRGLERKTTTVFTLLKASVYSIVLQQEIFGDEAGVAGDEATPRRR